MGLPRKGEMPFVLGFAAAAIWFYLDSQPWPAAAVSVLLLPFWTGRPFMVGAILATGIGALGPFYGQGGLAVGALGIGVVLSAHRLSAGSL